ncbi:MAG: Crp/Fnr family transcriptional regulator [Citrobacter freundii]|nr:MAG: Crp/Fnr family transcriptional regulator [Citrobacter freundii]
MNAQQLSTLFPGLETELYTELEQTGTIKEIPADSTVLRKGQTIRSAILLLEGVIKLYQEDEDGGEFFMYHINPGEACAVSMVCSYQPETSNVLATAVTDATVLLIPLSAMDQWMAKYKSWHYFVIQSYRSRYNELLNTIGEIAFRNMDERLEFYIRKQVKQFGHQIRLTHQEIANDLNSSREVISRLMKKMEKNEWIIQHRNSFEWIKDDRSVA